MGGYFEVIKNCLKERFVASYVVRDFAWDAA